MGKFTKNASNRIKIKRYISAIMVGVLCLTGVCTATYFQSKEVHAKDTLESISQVVRSITKENPFEILEIVPDTVSFNTIIYDYSGKEVTLSGNQTMGFTGYYVGGYEPIRYDMDTLLNDKSNRNEYVYSSLNDTGLRMSMFDALAAPLISENGIAYRTTGSGKDTKPLYIRETDGYKEIREGEIIDDPSYSDLDFSAYINNNGWRILKRDYTGTRVGGDGVAYVDMAAGNMRTVDIGEGNYARSYYVESVSDNSINIAHTFIDGYLSNNQEIVSTEKSEDGKITITYDKNFIYLPFDGFWSDSNKKIEVNSGEERINGEFDPNLKNVRVTYDESDNKDDTENNEEEKPNIKATFRYDSGLTNGYRPVPGSEIIFNNPDKESLKKYPTNLPLYTKEENSYEGEEDIYVYAGTLGDIFSISANTVDTSEGGEIFSNDGNETQDKLIPVNVTENYVENQEALAKPEINSKIKTSTLESSKIELDDFAEDITNEDLNDELNEEELDSDEVIDTINDDHIGDQYGESENENRNEMEGDSGEESKDKVYYSISFYYEDQIDSRILYSVSSFEPATVETGAQYILDVESTRGVLVPNHSGHGTIIVGSECPDDYFIYDYCEGDGSYDFVGITNPAFSTNDVANYYRIRGAEIYYKIDITNNEWFKRNILDRDDGEQCDKLPIIVNSLPASMVNADNVVDADLIMIMSGDAQFCIGKEESFDNYSFGDNDINVSVMSHILSAVVNDDVPVVGDYRIVTDYESMIDGLEEEQRPKQPLVTRLIKALMYSPTDMSRFLDIVSSYGDATIYENTSLLDNDYEITKIIHNSNGEEHYHYHYVKESVYIYDRKLDTQELGVYTNFLNDKLMKAFPGDEITDGFMDVYNDIDSENLYRKAEKLKVLDTTVSQASTVRYIIGYRKKRSAAQNKGIIHILEVEPCAAFDLSTDSNSVDREGNIIGTKLIYKNDRNNPKIDQEDTQIIITRMTSAEFIGRIEDINVKYDMIYFGLNIDKFNQREAKQKDVEKGRATQEEVNKKVKIADYNDLNMDGLVYSNVGDYVYMRINLAGMLDIEKEADGSVKSSNKIRKGEDLYKTRYSGNDITQEKVIALKNFVNAGFPIVVADDFFAGKNKDNINSRKIDTASYMYKFMDEVKGEDNVFKFSNLSDRLFNFYLNLSKPKLTMYGDAEASMSSTQNVYKNEDGYFYVPFNFKVENRGAVSATDDYYVNLYIDVNADGKYSKTQESVDFTKITDSTTGDIITKSGGTYAVKPGIEYYAIYRLSGQQTGVIPWRVIVRQSSNEYRRADATGYYQMSNIRPEINVLQINSIVENSVDYGKSQYTGRSLYGRNDNSWVNAGWTNNVQYNPTWDMQAEYAKGEGNKFYDLINDPCVPYDIKIKTVTSTEFSAMSEKYREKCIQKLRINSEAVKTLNTTQRNTMSVEISTYDDDTKNEIRDQYKEILASYDMVIMGFGDNYVAPNVIAVDAIKDFVNSGHSILFTHDCTSTVNMLIDQNGYSVRSNGTSSGLRVIDGTSANTGYECNKSLRHMVGMDRYNVLNEANDSTFEHDVIYKPRTSRSSANQITNSQIHGFTFGNINTCGYFDVSPERMYENTRDPENRNDNVNPSEGLTNIKGIDHEKNDYAWQDSKGNTIYAVGQYNEMSVKQVNKGQITEYPYHLDESFPVANTHEQWFQLDFTADDDFDGESDIVVWYCIEGSPLVNENKDMYKLSPGDVRNNYYIYNKGNVTYSGVGHSDIMKGDSENEIKLFINTMVAAYRSGIHPPEVSFKDSYEGRRSAENIYVTYDEQIEAKRAEWQNGEKGEEQGGLVGFTKDVYFMPEQVSIVQNAEFVDHKLEAKMYYEVPAGTPGAVKVRYNSHEYDAKELPIYTEGDYSGVSYMDPDNGAIMEGDLNNLRNGAVYKVTFKLNEMGQFLGNGTTVKNSIRLYVVATDSVSNSRTGTNSVMSSTAAANIVRTEVFDLD